MLSDKLKIRLSFFLGLLSWLLFLFFDLYLLFIESYQLKVNLSAVLPQVFFSSFVISSFFYFRQIISKADSINFMDLLWRVFITGLITTIASLGVRLFFSIFANNNISQNPITVNFFYHVVVGLMVLFIISTFVVWKRLILYQKSKNLIQLWSFFEYFLLASLIFDLLGNKMLSVNFNVALVFLSGFSLILSFNLKWIAYLNFKQKWKSILFILLSGVYIYHFLITLEEFSSTGLLTTDLRDRVFIVSLFIFIILYSVITVLVTLFNLPTSSVFEKKLQEAVDFQKLSHSNKGGTSIEETSELLLESSMSAVFADAAWLQIRDENPLFLTRGVKELTIKDLEEKIKLEYVRDIIRYRSGEDVNTHKVISSLSHPDFKSILAIPIFIKGQQMGVLALLQEVGDAFNREMVDIIVTFVNQASISIENTKLINEAIENERYKEQLSIAKNVQKSLLPDKLSHNEKFDIVAYSVAADEVGGDYYDIIESEKNIFSLIIADVSGKGTSAAFNMAQMKGIFHSLAIQKENVSKFITMANKALGECLEKSSFITASYFKIDTENQTIQHTRAGHCPAIFHSAKAKKICYLESEGLGLGILRNSEFNHYVEEKTITYQPDDLLLLYTDGIIEAKNPNGEQYGTKGLEVSLLRHIDKPLEEIKEGLIEDLQSFLEGEKLDDDYTLTVVKFYK
ncbi:MAG: SpoIIE family protein phosphatase [Cyclobacteriaceae bacterium]